MSSKLITDTLENLVKNFTEEYGVEEALADYLGIETDEVHYTGNEQYGLPIFETDNGEEYLVTDDYDEVEEACYYEVESLLNDGGISNFNVDIEDVVDTDWFDDAMRESYEYYVDDIRNEEADNPMYDSRLEQEMADANCTTKKSFVKYLCDDWNSSIEWFVTNFGRKELDNVINNNDLLDVHKLTDICISADGAGHLLASYDGNECEFTYEGHTFYAYRIN